MYRLLQVLSSTSLEGGAVRPLCTMGPIESLEMITLCVKHVELRTALSHHFITMYRAAKALSISHWTSDLMFVSACRRSLGIAASPFAAYDTRYL